MPWVPPAIIAGGMVGSSLLGGLMGSQGSGDTSREAARRQIELATNQSVINSKLMAPYVGAGNLALQQLWGYTPGGLKGPTGQQATGGGQFSSVPISNGGTQWKLAGGSSPTGQTGGGGYTTKVPVLSRNGTGWDSGTSVGSKRYSQTGPGIDRTGGAGKYLAGLEDLSTNFKFDPNDPGYKYKTEEAQKSIDKALAARGLFDSRAGVNMLADSDRAIMADEYGQQYDRKYGSLMDLFKMSSSLGETEYQKLLDAVKVGTGAGAAAGSLGNAGASNIISSYGQMSAAGAQDDANKASLWSGIGAMPMNAMLLYNLMKGSGGGYNPGVGMTGYGAN